MSVNRRAPRRLLIVTLAVPVVLAVYGATVMNRAWSVIKPLVATVLGVGVIGSVYADIAISRSPARVTPVRAATVLALAVVLAGASIAPAPTHAAKPAEQVIAAAQKYLGVKYKWGATGPNRFDCSGLIFRVFNDVGELPRVGGFRMRAVGYLKWFKSRGLASKEGKRGDLVVYNNGKHIGIYLGDGRVLSAIIPRVTVHPLNGIRQKVTAFLNVQWNKGDGSGGSDDGQAGTETGTNGKKDRNRDRGNRNRGNGQGEEQGGGEAVAGGRQDSGGRQGGRDRSNRHPRGQATGTLNLRRGPGPDEKVVGWVSKGSEFTVLGTGESASGALWLNIEMANGRSGWIWSRWTTVDGG